MCRCDVCKQANNGRHQSVLLRHEEHRVLARVKAAMELQKNADVILFSKEVQSMIASIKKEHKTNVRKVLEGLKVCVEKKDVTVFSLVS